MKSLIALSLLLCASVSHAATATYRVTLAKGTAVIASQVVTVDVGHETTVNHTAPFHMPAGCATGAPSGTGYHVDGTGQSGQIVTVKPVGVDGDSVTVVINLANSEFSSAVPMRAGACNAQTPAMLKWDGSATFALKVGSANTFAIGDFVVVVTMVNFIADQGTAI